MSTKSEYVAPSTPLDFFGSGVTGTTLPDGTNDFTEGIVRQGNVGLNIVNATTLAAALDVNGAEVLRGTTLGNFAANAAIGTAAATVDNFSTVLIPQTTAGISLTIPNPTNTQSGRILSIGNTGTTSVTVGGTAIGAGNVAQFLWSGTAWLNIPSAANNDFFRSGATASTFPDGATDLTDSIVHNGQIGIGAVTAFTSATTPGATGVSAALDVSGAEILREITFNNFVANGAIGTAPLTVDIASVITINQTTAGRTLTIPNPTNTPFGRIVKIVNRGTASLTIGTQPIAAGTGVEFVWSTGNVWRPLMQGIGSISIDQLTDVDTSTTPPTNGQVLSWNGTNWVPVNASGGAPTIQVFQTPAVGTISPFPLVNTPSIYTSTTTFTNPSATRSMQCLVTWYFGELRIDLDTGVYNLSLRGLARLNGVTMNNPSAYDRRWGHRVVGTDRWVITTATSTFAQTIVLAPSASVTINLNYDYDVNVAPPAGTGALLIEPSQIVTLGWLL